jgi:hypothetical protein
MRGCPSHDSRRGPRESHGAVEDAAGPQAAFEDVGQQFFDVGAGWVDAAGQGDVPHDHVHADRAVLVGRHADAADRAAVAHGCEGGLQGLHAADAFEDGVRAEAVRQLPDLLSALPAAFGDDVGGAELDTEVGACLVTAHQDDALGSQALGGQDGEQADRSVADDRDARAWADPGGDGGVVARAVHVGKRHQRGQQGAVFTDWEPDQRARGLRYAHRLALAAVDAVPAVAAPVRTGGLEVVAAVLARVVGVGERGQHEVAAPEPGYVAADVLDDAEEFVPYRPALVGGGHRVVGVQVASADRRAHDAHDRVGGRLDWASQGCRTARSVGGMDRRTELRDFLISRRAKITPEQAGLTAFGDNRRVPRLRREELAMLAGVSVDYYVRLERGTVRGPSDSVLESIA